VEPRLTTPNCPAASTRLWTSSFSKMCATCVPTVFSLMKSRPAICLFVSPSAHVAQGCDDRRERELLAAELHALTVKDEKPSPASARLELADKAGLAHTGLAGEQH
jgi:hypothetical protein